MSRKTSLVAQEERSPNEAGTAGVAFAILVAGAIFSASVLSLVLVAEDHTVPSAGSMDEPLQEAQAEMILEMMMRSEGVTVDGETIRFGLGDMKGGLQQDGLIRVGVQQHDDVQKVKNPRDPDSYKSMLNAFQARIDAGGETPLGDALDRDFDFRLQIRPLGVDKAGVDLSGLRVAYIGDACFASGELIQECAQLGKKNTFQASRLQYQYFFSDEAEEETGLLSSLGVRFRDQLHFQPSQTAENAQASARNRDRVDQRDLSDEGAPGNAYAAAWQTVDGVSIAEGDVFADQRSYLRDQLKDRLALYDVVVIGTGVDAGSLVNLRSSLDRWVDEGGHLVVLGVEESDSKSFRGLFQQDRTATAGPAEAPRDDHALLTFPHALRWQEYDLPAQGWLLDGNDSKHFTPVLRSGDAEVLATSKKGAFGEGSVVLSMLDPSDVVDRVGTKEARALLANLIVNAKIDPVLVDLGPPIPTDRPIGQSMRMSHFQDEHLGQVPVQITLHLWYT